MGLVFLGILIVAAASIIITTLHVGISPMPTSKRVMHDLERFLSLISLQEGKIFELGSGFGSLAFLLARQFPKYGVSGYELSWVPYLVSLFVGRVLQRKNLQFHRKDFFTVCLQEASLVTCYLFPDGMERLKEKLLRELPKGAYVLSHTFAFRSWKPIQVIEARDLSRTKIYLYRI